MSATQQQVQMAAKLYEMRDTAKHVLGDKYWARMMELGCALKMMSEREGKDVLAVATEACKTNSLAGIDVILIMAAAVELMEPTQ